MVNLSMLAAADTTNLQAGGRSFFDSTLDFATKGLGSAVVSGAYAMYNTGVDLANKVFDAGAERADTMETLNNFDRDWAEYYRQNKDLVDTTGLFVGSLVPGSIALKGLRMAASAGEAGGVFARALGFASGKQTAYLKAALSEVAQQGGTVFSAINKNKLASMTWGLADQVLQVAAYETATALAMHASPTFEGKDLGDIAWDITKTSLAGGVLGGGIQALFTNKIVKDAGKLVAGKQREYDALATLDKVAISFGDKAYSIVDAVLALPKDTAGALIPFKYAKDGVLDTSALMDKTLRGTVQRGVEKLETHLVEVAPDKSVGKPLAQALTKLLKDGIEAGADDASIRQELGNYLLNLRSVEGIGGRPISVRDDILYLDPSADFSKKAVLTATKVEGAVPYRIVGDLEQAKRGTAGKDFQTVQEGLAAGMDIIIDPVSRKVIIHPESEIVKKLTPDEANFAASFLNTRTLQTSDTTVPTIADIATSLKPLQPANVQGISAGNKTFKFSISSFDEPVDSIEATARHLWAAELPVLRGQAASNDFSILDALIQNPGRVDPSMEIWDIGRKQKILWSELQNPEAYVFRKKYDEAIKLLEAGGESADLRKIAYRLNVEAKWLQDAVDTRFSLKELWEAPGHSRDLASYGMRENLVLRYDTSAMGQAAHNATGIVAYTTRVQEATMKARDAFISVVGAEAADRFIDIGSSITKFADAGSVGPTMVGASNAGYTDPIRQWAQYTGTLVANLSSKAVSAALSKLQNNAAALLKNPQAAGEVAAAMTKLRTSPGAYSLHRDALSQQYMIVDTASYKAHKYGGASAIFKETFPLGTEAGDFIAAHHNLHGMRVDKQGVLQTAQGLEKRWDPDQLYMPPVDTRRVPFFAFVRQHDGTVFGSSDVAMIVARDAADLQAKAAAIEASGPFKVIYKQDTENFFKAKGDYEFSRTMNAPEIDSYLRKSGKLGDYLPNMTPEAVVEEFVQYTQRAETKLVRDAVEVRYGQQFAELRDLSERYVAPQQSRMRGFDKFFKPQDPFGDAANLALNISKRSEYAMWHQANEFVDAAGQKAYRLMEGAMLAAKDNKITWQEANDQLAKFGIGAHYTDEHLFDIAQTASDRNLLKIALNKANVLLTNGMLRLDLANSLMNVLSTPILLGTEVQALRKAVKADPEMIAFMQERLSTTVPGTALQVPSASKLMFQAVRNFFAPDAKDVLTRYKEIGAVKGQAELFHTMMDDLSLTPNLVPSKFAATADKWVEQAAKVSLGDKAEEFTRFVSANVMHQLTEPMVKKGAMTIPEQNAWISTFVNRVQGNYVSSQRPILFQGTLGSAVGLFQTYQFNLLQQLFRHIENKDAKTIAVMAGLQSTLYGLHGLPFFEAVNTQLVGGASINAGHKDIYSYAVQAAGKDAGDWLLYGTASAMPLFGDKAPALWSRGDMNPRNLTMIPVNPMDVPAVQASMKVIGNLVNTAKQIGGAGDIQGALLHGLEHNGLSRPLAGLAQVVKGTATTSKGDLISAASDWNSIATASRLIGAKPMDESIALNTVYRSKAYEAMDKQRIDTLATGIKEKLRSGEPIASDDWTELQGKYAAAGGRAEGFAAALQRWDTSANTSLINSIMEHNRTPAGQRMILMLGGEPIEDLRNTPAQ